MPGTCPTGRPQSPDRPPAAHPVMDANGYIPGPAIARELVGPFRHPNVGLTPVLADEPTVSVRSTPPPARDQHHGPPVTSHTVPLPEDLRDCPRPHPPTCGCALI